MSETKKAKIEKESNPEWDAINAIVAEKQYRFMYSNYLDTPEEKWLTLKSTNDDSPWAGLAIWRDGELTVGGEAPVPPKGVVCQRRVVLYDYANSLFVEMCDYGEGRGIQLIAVDNGYRQRVPLNTDDIDKLIQHYEKIGFVRVGAWHLLENKVIRRNNSLNRKSAVCILNNRTVEVGEFTETCETREEAEQLMEQKLAELVAEGGTLGGIESWRGSGNPPPVTPLVLPELKQWPKPTSARDAVDQAVARVKELHDLFPRGNCVMEQLKLPDDKARADGFCSLNDPRVGEWHRDDRETPASDDSSWHYFRKKYGSLTWVNANTWMEPDVDTGKHMDNDASCLLSIEKEQSYNGLEEMADAEEEPKILKLHVFDGCWRYAFDTTSVIDKHGEHPIVDFDESEPQFFEGEPGDEFQAFGYWLLERVDEIIPKLVPWLALLK